MMARSTEETTAEEEAAGGGDTCCASCGVAGVDNVKLKICACGLVKYCSVACQKDHRPQHKKMCKKQMAEIREKKLFTQPDESHLGDCSICCLPMSLDPAKTTLNDCCSQLICNGCNVANKKREHEAGLEKRCAFCREPMPKSEEEGDKNMMNRVKKNDPVAMCEMAKKLCNQGDYESALQYLTKAAELGNAEAHFVLSDLYHHGEGVEKDTKKQVYHLEEAAMKGHPEARHDLGCIEEGAKYGKFERSKKHFIIAANLGCQDSLKLLKDLYSHGRASKEEYADALRAYQTAVDATKSAEREKAEAFLRINP
jgi:tetratricopeptide (TPR) repeat protein